MKIIKFKDGTFVIRKFSILRLKYVYYDPSIGAWWKKDDGWFEDCLFYSLDKVITEYEKLTDKGTIIKP